MDKDDWYFLISTLLAVLGLLGLDWKLVTGRVALRQHSPSRKREWFLLLAIMGSIVMSAIGLYEIHSGKPKSILLNISAYDPPYPAPMRVVSDQTFENQDVQLDGLIYENCSFTNVCFMYDGGAFGLHNSTVKTKWKVCVRDSRLKNYLALMEATHALASDSKSTKKTAVAPF